MIRNRLKERIPRVRDEDLPTHEVSETELIDRIVRRTGDDREKVRRILYEVGVFVPPRPATSPLKSARSENEASTGSGIPEDTAQSGMMSMD